jgi:hypothetical protein
MELGHTARVELAGSVAAVRAVLADPESLLGFSAQPLDLPILGPRDQTVVTTPGADFSCAGALWSVSGTWRLEPDGGSRVRAALEVSCRVADALAREAVDAYRSRSPLPIRTDADAILGRLVEDLFREKLAADVDAYHRRVAALLAASQDAASSASPRPRAGGEGQGEGALLEPRERA